MQPSISLCILSIFFVQWYFSPPSFHCWHVCMASRLTLKCLQFRYSLTPPHKIKRGSERERNGACGAKEKMELFSCALCEGNQQEFSQEMSKYIHWLVVNSNAWNLPHAPAATYFWPGLPWNQGTLENAAPDMLSSARNKTTYLSLRLLERKSVLAYSPTTLVIRKCCEC